MAKFKDAKNREWLLAINILSAERVKKATNVDCYRLLGDNLKPLQELFENVYVLAHVAFELTRGQRPDVTVEDFAEAMDADSLYGIQHALCEAIIEITPTAKRANVRKLFDRLLALEGHAVDNAGTVIDRTFDKLQAQFDELVRGDDNETEAQAAAVTG